MKTREPAICVAFPGKSPEADEPGKDAWAWVTFQPSLSVERKRPDFWREFYRRKWRVREDGQSICPALF